jgi:hypothetical protein
MEFVLIKISAFGAYDESYAPSVKYLAVVIFAVSLFWAAA